jgi:hypothetical protein
MARLAQVGFPPSHSISFLTVLQSVERKTLMHACTLAHRVLYLKVRGSTPLPGYFFFNFYRFRIFLLLC